VPAKDDGERATHFSGDDDGKQNVGHADRRHIRRGRGVDAEFAEAGQQ
jgi:hypothetical protein